MEKVKNIFGSLGFYCFIAAVVFITICSKSSFFYPLNDWGDVDCYFTIGQGMLRGLVPYRDLYDQKGIVIFTLYAIANFISDTSFIGGYFLEIISASLFLFLTMKTAGLFCDLKGYELPLCFVLAGSVYSSASICHGGSAEELLLPMFSYGLYLCVKQVQTKIIPDNKEMLLFGILAGLIFFSKFSLCLIYLGFIAVMIIDSAINKYFLLLMKRAFLFILGCILICIPVIAYFVYNGALKEFYEAYFYNNIFYYAPVEEHYSFIFRTSTFFRKRNILDVILLLLGVVYLLREKKKLLLAGYLGTFVTFFYLSFFSVYPQKYYGIPLYVFEAFGIPVLVEFFDKKEFFAKKVFNALAIVIMIIVAFVFTNNKYLMFKSREETRQFKLAAKMETYGYEDYHMLSYNNLDDGYYFATGKFPNFRAFIQDNLTFDDLKNEQNEIINEGKVEFIVTKKILCDTNDYEETLKKYGELKKKDIVTFDNFKYELAYESEEFYEDEYFIVKLYKIKD